MNYKNPWDNIACTNCSRSFSEHKRGTGGRVYYCLSEHGLYMSDQHFSHRPGDVPDGYVEPIAVSRPKVPKHNSPSVLAANEMRREIDDLARKLYAAQELAQDRLALINKLVSEASSQANTVKSLQSTLEWHVIMWNRMFDVVANLRKDNQALLDLAVERLGLLHKVKRGLTEEREKAADTPARLKDAEDAQYAADAKLQTARQILQDMAYFAVHCRSFVYPLGSLERIKKWLDH